ncbi:anti-sigma regulatory factor (Ser/Thr protein kinase) [Actinopolyspora biskrensis]|uniref:Anti-sigma regulatory factor (Ser/Thr protein kinase) n=1 Tax=Actinopolyspora biskrensis TaxID=1470178 RepID=A0A852Z104_9ACTN|nr:ATP-binding protein [Actinopolyspora biskrensis]NYH79662.1 anti-sigma regulatory factor (Ser/Thr protein kinase) [Actinopolyspora biskrensis]
MTARPPSARGDPDSELCYRDVPAAPERLPPLRNALAEWAGTVGLDAEQVEVLMLASYEALANVVAHAYPDGSGVLDLEARLLPEPTRVEVTVTDYGRWCPESEQRRDLGGRGLILLRSLAEHAEVLTGGEGTTVRMSWTPAQDPVPEA